MMTYNHIFKKRRMFFGIVASLFTSYSFGQVTESYTMQTSNFNTQHTINTSTNYGAGAGNNGSSEINTYAYGNGSGYIGDPGIALFRSFSDDGSSTSGSNRSLQVGDEFKVTAYVGNNSSFFSGSSAGISLNNGTSNSTFSNYNSNQRLKLQISQGGSWYVAGQAAAAGFANAGQDVTLTFKVTSSNTVNVEINGANASPQTGASTSELELSGSGAIQSFSIWNQTSGSFNDVYWKNCSVKSTGSVEFGGNNQTNSLTTISGVISDGYAANSTTITSANSVTKNGSGTITLTGANTYTGSTTVNSGELIISGSGTLGTGSTVIVNSGATLRVKNSITIASLTNSGTVEIDPGATLSITGNLVSSSGSITINADATGYGQLLVDGTITGTITQEQYIGSTGHHGISSPMSDGFGTTANCTPGSLYGYDAITSGAYVGSYLNNNTSVSTSGVTSVGRGFFAPVGNAGDFLTSTGSFTVTGTPNTSHDWTLSYVANSQSGASDNGWNLIGNPYSATLDWSTVSVGSSVNGAVYVWDPSNSQYMSWTSAGGGVNGGSQYIPPMQAFWVQTTSGGTGTAYDISTTMSSNSTTSQSPTFQKTQNDRIKLSIINLSEPSKNDETVIAHSPGSVDGFDEKLDAWKLNNYGGNPNLYSFYAGDKLAVNVVDLSVPKVIPLSVDAPQSKAAYQLYLNQEVNGDEYEVILEDKHLNTFTDLTQGAYSFQYGGWNNSGPRFNLHINGAYNIGLDEVETHNSFVYQKDNEVFIHTDEAVYSKCELWTMDGRLVHEGPINTSITRFLKPNTGLYMIQLKGNHSNKAIKTFLK